MTPFTVHEGIGLIFDMDGVILHSNPIHMESWLLYLKREGLPESALKPEKMYGKRNDQIFADLYPDASPEEIAQRSRDKEALYRELMAPRLEEQLTPGLRELLESNRHRPIGMGTNAERANADFVLDEARLRPYFWTVVDGWMVARPKPAPDIYLQVAHNLGLPARNCIIFEDSYSGVTAGLAAGARVVGVTSTHADFPQLDMHIRDFTQPQLADWLSRQRPV
ncbi:MAG: HAD family phosphatase [Bryobacterales bacterium]|jgi:HAD superfamily hydrolase (TIGR01509 family)|nr:HAD family phosphatase [Bryobacterales bacterium]